MPVCSMILTQTYFIVNSNSIMDSNVCVGVSHLEKSNLGISTIGPVTLFKDPRNIRSEGPNISHIKV